MEEQVCAVSGQGAKRLAAGGPDHFDSMLRDDGPGFTNPRQRCGRMLEKAADTSGKTQGAAASGFVSAGHDFWFMILVIQLFVVKNRLLAVFLGKGRPWTAAST